MSTFPKPTDGESIDFLEERDSDTKSWDRADPREALINSVAVCGDPQSTAVASGHVFQNSRLVFCVGPSQNPVIKSV